jgi:hypothetical protein|tara:strand:+ start:100 stop:339 length:240 start_codon:yes stop_codon:yes gene_type:complete
MDPSTGIIGIYLSIFILLLMVAYAGMDGTMRLFMYLDLQLRYAILRIRMGLLGWKLRRHLRDDASNYEKLIREIQKNDQ